MCSSTRTEGRAGKGIQLCLRLVGDVRKDHGNPISGMLVAGTGDNDAAALEFGAIMRRLQCNGHFRPFVEWGRAAKFNAAFVNRNCVGGKFQPGLPAFNCHRFFGGLKASNFSRAHNMHKQTNTPRPIVKLDRGIQKISSPLNNCRPPRQTGTKRHDQNQIAPLDLARSNRLIERDGDRCCGGVAVFVEVDE